MFPRALLRLRCSELQGRHSLAEHEKPVLCVPFLGNTSEGELHVKLLLLCLRTAGGSALEQFAVAVLTVQTAEGKSSRAGKEREVAVRWRVSQWL